MTTWIESICWTLLHSLWQGLSLLLVLELVLRAIPSPTSSARYNLAVTALGLQFLLCIVTFATLSAPAAELAARTAVEMPAAPVNHPTLFSFADKGTWTQLQQLVAHYQQLIFYCWAFGAVLFSLRYISGIAYIRHLKSSASAVDSLWQSRLHAFATRLKISRIVHLAESSKISVPMVAGFFKPFILVPVGILSGLSVEQAESVLLHELAHVRRNDFLVNLLQSAGEALLFFNPFVWMISARIRKEREHCCDDLVTGIMPNPVAYATALTQLAEFSMPVLPMAPALGRNKNELLNRIKRIMEKSTKNQKGEEKFLPIAALLIAGLVCASWLNFKPNPAVPDSDSVAVQAADTTVRDKKEKTATYSRKAITVSGENGQPQVVFTETFEGDEALRPLVEATALEPLGGFDGFPPPEPALADALFTPGMPEVPDTLPDISFYHHENDWETFGKEFEKEFKSQFGDFYKSNSAGFEKMMKDLEKRFNDREWQRDVDRAMRLREVEMQNALGALEDLKEDNFHQQMKKNDEVMQRMQEKLRSVQEDQMKQMREMELLQRDKMKKMEEAMKIQTENMKAFESEMKDQLIKDGYLGKNEKLQNLHWDTEGEIVVNGKQIKAADKPRYLELHRKYFKGDGTFTYVE